MKVGSQVKMKMKLKKLLKAALARKKMQPKWQADFAHHAEAVDKIYNPSFSVADGLISDDLLAKLQRWLNETEVVDLYDCVEAHSGHSAVLMDKHSSQTLDGLNSNIRVHGLHLLSPSDELIKELHDELRSLFTRYVGSPFIFVNTRMWSTRPGAQRFGPNSMHLDGFLDGHMKIMTYLTPMNEAHGYLEYQGGEIKSDRAGRSVCFRNSDLPHAGVPGTEFDRTCIEVTLMRSLVNGAQRNHGHFFGRHLKTPSLAYQVQTETLELNPVKRPEFEGKLVNIGSGKTTWEGWVCVDQLDHPGIENVTLDAGTTLPFEPRTVSLFYSSHCFEHLSTDTVERLISEMERTLAQEGRALIKIPDFDWFLSQYKNNIGQCVDGVGVESVVNSWSAEGVDDTTENRLAMMFCGYWNSYYGDHFSGKINTNTKAYHGPPMMDAEKLKSLFLERSPNQISAELCLSALADDNFKDFNHRNAWSRDELTDLVKRFGLEVETTDKSEIVNSYSTLVPDITSMMDWSAYYLIKRA
jgi:hypothetical protein